MLHRIFQRHHIPPNTFHAMKWKHQAFMFASEEIAYEEEKAKNKRQGGG